MVVLTPDQQDESGYLYLAMGKQYLAASNELTRKFQTEQDVLQNLLAIVEFYEAMAQNFGLAMELFLKAYLRAQGVAEKVLTKDPNLRHNLVALRDLAVAEGLHPSADTAAALDALGPYYADHRFRYVKVSNGELEVRSPLELRKAAQELYTLSHRAVRDRGKQLNLVVP